MVDKTIMKINKLQACFRNGLEDAFISIGIYMQKTKLKNQKCMRNQHILPKKH